MSRRIRSIAVLGAGAMGQRMATNLVRAGLEVRAWDPDPERAASVPGALPATRAAEAADDADAVLTMAPDGPAVEATMFGDLEAAKAMPPGSLWLQASTIGVEWAERFARQAAEHGLVVIDAPVIGTLDEAEEATLCFFAAGPEPGRAPCQPLLDIMGQKTYWYQRPGDGQRMKLSLNN